MTTHWLSTVGCAACGTSGRVLWTESGHHEMDERCTAIEGPFVSRAGYFLGRDAFEIACAGCGALVELRDNHRPSDDDLRRMWGSVTVR